jgi:hypothetical protein
MGSRRTSHDQRSRSVYQISHHRPHTERSACLGFQWARAGICHARVTKEANGSASPVPRAAKLLPRTESCEELPPSAHWAGACRIGGGVGAQLGRSRYGFIQIRAPITRSRKIHSSAYSIPISRRLRSSKLHNISQSYGAAPPRRRYPARVRCSTYLERGVVDNHRQRSGAIMPGLISAASL